MPDPFSTGMAALSLVGGISRLFGKGGSGSETTTRMPAPRTADQGRFWDDFVNSWFGTAPAGENELSSGGSSGVNQYLAMDKLKNMYSKYGGGGDNTEGTPFPKNLGFGHDPGNLPREARGAFNNAGNKMGPKFWATMSQADPQYAAKMFEAVHPGSQGIDAYLNYFGHQAGAGGSSGGGNLATQALNSIPGKRADGSYAGGESFQNNPNWKPEWGDRPTGLLDTPGDGMTRSMSVNNPNGHFTVENGVVKESANPQHPVGSQYGATMKDEAGKMGGEPLLSMISQSGGGLVNPPTARNPSQGTPGLRDMMADTDLHERGVFESYLGETDKYTNEFLSGLGNVKKQFFNPMSGKIGGNSVSIIPRGAARSGQNVLSLLSSVSTRRKPRPDPNSPTAWTTARTSPRWNT